MVSRRTRVASWIFRRDHPSRPNAMICCFFSSFKTFAMSREATYPPAAVNVLDVSSESMAAFQVFMYGRFWVFTEVYLGPQDLRLKEKIPADIALDANYRAEFQRGAAMYGFPGGASVTSQELDQQIVKTAEDPLFSIPKQLDPKLTQRAIQDCLDRRKGRSDTPQ